MFVHVNCSCSPLLSFVYARREPASPTVQRRRDLNVFPARSLHAQVPQVSKQLQSVRQHGRDSIGLLQDLVQDQVDCTPEEQRRRERVDPERLLHAWHGRESPAKAAFSFSTPRRGFKPNQVGARKNLVLSMPVTNLLTLLQKAFLRAAGNPL